MNRIIKQISQLQIVTFSILLTGTVVGSPASIEYIVYQRPDSSHYVFTDQCLPGLEKALKFKWSYRGDYMAGGKLAIGLRIVTDPSQKSLAAIQSVNCVLAVEPGLSPSRRIAVGEDIIIPDYGSSAWERLEANLSYEKADCESYGGRFLVEDPYVGGQIDNGSSMLSQVYVQSFRCEKADDGKDRSQRCAGGAQ